MLAQLPCLRPRLKVTSGAPKVPALSAPLTGARQSRRAVSVDLVEVPVAVVCSSAPGPLPHECVRRAAGLSAEELGARAGCGQAPAGWMVGQAAGEVVVSPLVGVRDVRCGRVGAEDRAPD